MINIKSIYIPLLLFVVLAFGLAWSVWLVMKGSGIYPALGPHFSTSPGYLLLMSGASAPTVAALAVVYSTEGNRGLIEFVFKAYRLKVHARWYLIALGLPIGLALLATVLYSIFQMRMPTINIGPLLGLAPQFVWTLFLGGPLEEELGWRGFAFPRLQQMMSPLAASVFLGLIWGLWHMPLFLLQGSSQYALVHQQAAVLWFLGFLIQTILLSIVLGWLMDRTKSVVIAMLLHASANVAYSVLAVLRIYNAWALLIYISLLALAALVIARRYLSQKASITR